MTVGFGSSQGRAFPRASHGPRVAALAASCVLFVTATTAGPTQHEAQPRHPFAAEHALGAVRGMTIGPIENELFRGRGYGSAAYDRTLTEVRRLGASWVSLTPFGRVWDLQSTGIDWRFESPPKDQLREITSAIERAHARGLKVMLVPHLWVERGGWRGEMNPPSDEAWERWKASYEAFVLRWASVSERLGVDLFSVGVELRSWVTSTHAVGFDRFVARVRGVYSGPLTYAANWDDAHDTIVWDELDVIGINAFFPLAKDANATLAELRHGASDVAAQIEALSRGWNKPVLFTEIGYTTRSGAAVDPWEWPDDMTGVTIDELTQARAYHGLISAFLDRPWFLGFFVWRMYADPDDMSQEAQWGFSPRGKLAELVLRDAFDAHFAADGPRPVWMAYTPRAHRIGL